MLLKYMLYVYIIRKWPPAGPLSLILTRQKNAFMFGLNLSV